MISAQTKKLEERLLQFGVRIIREINVLRTVPSSVTNQIVRSSTSVGANFAEAQDAASKKDFLNKIMLAKKEVSETRYWLKVIEELNTEIDYSELQQEAHEIHMILQKIVSSSRGASINW